MSQFLKCTWLCAKLPLETLARVLEWWKSERSAESSLLVLPPSNMHPATGIYTFIRVLCTSILPSPLCTLLTSSGAYCCLQGLPLRWQQHPHLRMTRHLITYSDLLSTNKELRLRDSWQGFFQGHECQSPKQAQNFVLAFPMYYAESCVQETHSH